VISTSPGRIYGLVCDLPRMGEWSPECERVEWAGGTTVAAEGARFTGHNRGGPFGLMRWSRHGRVLAADPGREFAFVTEEGGRESTVWRYRFEVIHHLGPQGAGSPLHVHHRENEWFYVLQGELTVWVGGQVIRAPAGSFVFGPQGTSHTFTVSSPDGASFLLVTEPGGFEAFMRTCAEPARSLTPPPPASPPGPAQIAALAAEYGIDIIGPPGIPS